jgi:hypothetical protein
MVRELGSERRETVWSLSAVFFEENKNPILVREEWKVLITSIPIVTSNASR